MDDVTATETIYEERHGSYKYVEISTDPDGTVRETATNAAGNGLFNRTVYKGGVTDWRQITGTVAFHARSLADFKSRLNHRR